MAGPKQSPFAITAPASRTRTLDRFEQFPAEGALPSALEEVAFRDQHIMIPSWPYSFVVALEAGHSSWTAPLDALRLAHGDDLDVVTAAQLRDVVGRLMAARQWRAGDADILIVADAGCDGPRLTWLLRDLPVQILARMRSDRVLRRPAPARVAGTNGRPPCHGSEHTFRLTADLRRPGERPAVPQRLSPGRRNTNRLHATTCPPRPA
ncbi:transposase [Nonomuraea sp. NPDC049400]|uniref:transposase n=1 Tax=Nonomuraea sp. NPDC049400 TaxID=3364352 RepID=UPI0037A36F3F